MSWQLSERVRFYLKYQRRIDEWAKIRDEAAGEAHGFFASLAGPLRQHGDDDCLLYANLDRTEPPKLFLYKPAWRPDPDRAPRVAIGLEWPQTPSFDSAYTGVWVNRAFKAESAKLYPALLTELGRVLPGFGVKARVPAYRPTGQWWPAFRVEAPPEGYWTPKGLAAYSDQLRSSVLDLWTLTSTTIDNVITQAGPS